MQDTSGLCLDDILIDVACGNDDVKIWFRALADGFDVVLTTQTVVADARDVLLDIRLYGLGCVGHAVHGQLRQVELAAGDILGYLLRRLAGLYDCVADEEGHALSQKPFRLQLVDNNIG